MARMKLVHIVEAFGGGIFTYLIELCNSLSDEYEIVILYSKRVETPYDFKKYFNDNIKFIEIANMKRSISPNDLLAIKEVQEIINIEKPDIVHLHSSKAGVIGRVIRYKNNPKIFYTPHGYSFLKKDDNYMKRCIYKYIEIIMAKYKKTCITICCSKGEYNISKKVTSNSTYISNGIDLNDIKVLPKTKDNSKLKICTLGRISAQKNPLLFNQIAKKFLDFEFTWIGDGEDKELLTSPNINITGWKDRRSALEILNENDIFILTSLWEGLPLALLEAMGMGKICLVTNVIGNNDVITHNKNGFICSNSYEFENILNNIINNNLNLDYIRINAKNDINKIYNLKVMCDSYKDILENDITRKK